MPFSYHPHHAHSTAPEPVSAVESVMNCDALSVTGLGRNITSNAGEKYKIKRVDRLCSNTKLHQEIINTYCGMTFLLAGQLRNPRIDGLVTCPNGYLLEQKNASLIVQSN